MGRLFKILITLVLVVVLLVVAAVVVVPMVVDPNDYKQEIADQVKKATGRDLQIGGKIDLSVFPWLGIEINELVLSNAPGFGDQPFAVVDHAQVRAKLMPLLSKRLEVDKVRVQGLVLNLAKAQDGSSNWDDLAAGGEQKEVAGEAGAKPETPVDAVLGALAVNGLEISEARVVWDDRSAGQRYLVDGLGLSTGAIQPGKPLDVELGFMVDSAQPALKARVDLEGRVDMDPSMQKLSVSPLLIKLTDLVAEGLTGGASLEGRVQADLGGQLYGVEGLRLRAELHGEGLPEAGAGAELSADVAADLNQQTLALTGLKLKSGRLVVNGALHGTEIQSAPRFQGDLTLAEFSPRSLMADLGMPVPQTADPGVLDRLSAAFHLQSTPEQAVLEKLSVSLDDTKLLGNAKVVHAEQPGIRFDLQVDTIDLDRYLPPPVQADLTPEEVAAAKKQGMVPPEPAPLFPVETLRGLDVDGVFRVGSLIIQKLLARDIVLTLSSKDGRLRLKDEVRQFYQGALEGNIQVDVTGSQPRVSVEQHLAGVQAGPLLKDLTGKDQMTGTGQFNAKLNANGQTADALTRSLGGQLDFRFADGAVKGFNLAKVIREGKARITGTPLPPDNAPDQTDFSELSGSAVVTKGVLKNQDLLAKSPFLRVTGEGSVDLVAESLDYTVTPVVVSTEKGQGGEGLDELKGIPVPVHLTGTFAEPDYTVDWKTIVLETQKGKLDEQIDSQLDKALGDKVDDQTKEKLQGVLKGFFR